MKCEERAKCDWLRIRVMGWAPYGTIVGGCQLVKSSKPTGWSTCGHLGGCGLGELFSANRASPRSHPTFAPIGMSVTGSGSIMVLASRLCRVELLFFGMMVDGFHLTARLHQTDCRRMGQ